MIHVIEIREIVGGTKPGTVKFKSTANLTYNCNKEEFNGHWAVGEKYKIDFATSSFQGKHGTVEMKWVNNARFWQDGDGDVEPAEKAPYQGGGGGNSGSNGGGMKGSDYDPAVGKRQTAANCAMAWCAENVKTLEELSLSFPAVADVVHTWVDEAPKSNPVALDSEGPADATGDGDIPF